MQNFGRGMWRRVGDYERIHAPLISEKYKKEAELEKLRLYIETQQKLKREEQLKEYQEIMKNRFFENNDINITTFQKAITKNDSINDNTQIDDNNQNDVVLEKNLITYNDTVVSNDTEIVITPKKYRKKNKNKN